MISDVINKANTIISWIYSSDYEPPYSKMEFINVTLINKNISPDFIISTYSSIEVQGFYFLNENKNSSFTDNGIFQVHNSNFSLSHAHFK